MMNEHYDVFLSHANKDKLEYVDELKTSFDRLGISVFYDKDVLMWGDKWKKRIFDGVACCDFAVIVISDKFFGREWCEQELHALLSRQSKTGRKIVLPILYKTTSRKLKNRYKALGDIQYLDASKKSVQDITIDLAAVMLAERSNFVNGVVPETLDSKFAEFFRGHTLEFFEWFAAIIDGGNDYVDAYDTDMIGWEIFDINGAQLLQSKNDKFRINPKYYEVCRDYFNREIRSQID